MSCVQVMGAPVIEAEVVGLRTDRTLLMPLGDTHDLKLELLCGGSDKPPKLALVPSYPGESWMASVAR